MRVSDDELDHLETKLDAGGVIGTDAIRDLIDEVRASRRLLGLTANVVGFVGGEALRLAEQAEELVDHYREAALADDGHATIMTEDWPHGFELPAADDA